MSSILLSSFVIFAANYGPLSDIMLSGNLCNFHTLFLNSLANSFAKVSSIMATKCTIFDSLSYTTRIAFFSVTSSSLVMKSTFRYYDVCKD